MRNNTHNHQVLSCHWSTKGSVPVPDLVFVVLQVLRVSEDLRVAQVIGVLKEMMVSVQIPASLASAPQEHPVCLALQDPEVCLVPRGQ